MINIGKVPLLLLVCAAIVASAAPARAEKGYHLLQNSDFYGASDVYITPSYMRLGAAKLGVTIATSSPKYEIVGINDKNKQFTRMQYGEWRKTFFSGRQRGNGEAIKRGTSKIAGITADEYWVNCPTRPDPAKSVKHLWYKGRPYNTKYWVTKEIAAPGKLFEIFSDALNMPSNLGFPVRMIQYDRAGRSVTTFDTTKSSIAEVDTKIIVPKTFRKAEDELAFFVSGVKVDDIDLGFDDDELTGKPAAKKAQAWVPGMKASSVAPSVKVPASKQSGAWFPGR